MSTSATSVKLHLEKLGQIIKSKLLNDFGLEVQSDLYIKSEISKSIDALVLEETKKTVVQHFVTLDYEAYKEAKIKEYMANFSHSASNPDKEVLEAIKKKWEAERSKTIESLEAIKKENFTKKQKIEILKSALKGVKEDLASLTSELETLQ